MGPVRFLGAPRLNSTPYGVYLLVRSKSKILTGPSIVVILKKENFNEYRLAISFGVRVLVARVRYERVPININASC